MVMKMGEEGFGGCTNMQECEAGMPESGSRSRISRV
jgi:hypothetical protein